MRFANTFFVKTGVLKLPSGNDSEERRGLFRIFVFV